MADGIQVPAKRPEENSAGFTPAMVSKFLQNQEKELEIRKQNADLQKQQEANAFEFSKRALEAEAADRKHRRETQNGARKTSYIFIFLCLIVLASLIVYAISKDKDAFVMEMAKLMGAFFCGGAGGFALGRHKAPPGANSANNDSEE